MSVRIVLSKSSVFCLSSSFFYGSSEFSCFSIALISRIFSTVCYNFLEVYSVMYVIHNHVVEECLRNKKMLRVVSGFIMFRMLRSLLKYFLLRSNRSEK